MIFVCSQVIFVCCLVQTKTLYIYNCVTNKNNACYERQITAQQYKRVRFIVDIKYNKNTSLVDYYRTRYAHNEIMKSDIHKSV